MDIAIVGGGWYGSHLARELQKAGHKVVLYEKNSSIMSEISGSFGIRLHAGPHYPRSAETRKNCARNMTLFKRRYPELIVPHEYAIYGLGNLDAEGKPPKVNVQQFEQVCQEVDSCQLMDPQQAGYTNLLSAANFDEPSIVLGNRLRSAFTRYLAEEKVEVRCNVAVEDISPTNAGVLLSGKNFCRRFDKVINTTNYQAFLPAAKQNFPFDMEAVYQPCLALEYEDTSPGTRPFSFIVMDGWFPCIMPVCDDEVGKKYILTHGKWTIMGSYDKPQKAQEELSKLNNNWVEKNIKPSCEHEINRFWPAFAQRFRYIGWKGTVLTKLKTKHEFRSAVTFEKDHITHVLSGKISNVFDVEREVLALLAKENIHTVNGYSYVQGGVLQQAQQEIEERPSLGESNTCTLQTLKEIQLQLPADTAATLTSTTENASFILACYIDLAAGTALLAFSLIALFILPLPTSVIAGSVGALGLGIYSLFSSNNTSDDLGLENSTAGKLKC